MTPFNPDYHVRLYARAEEIASQNQLQTFVDDLKALGKTELEIDVEVFFALIHEGYRQRWMEEKMWEDIRSEFDI
jgi:hypothetical protein